MSMGLVGVSPVQLIPLGEALGGAVARIKQSAEETEEEYPAGESDTSWLKICLLCTAGMK